MSQQPLVMSWKGPPEANSAVYRPSSAGPSTPTVQPYRDEEQDERDERSHTPPPYSGPTSPSMVAPTAPQPQLRYPGLPHLNYSLYSPRDFTRSPDDTSITSYSAPLSIYPTQLSDLIKSLASIPPKPHVRIVGKTETGVGFDIKLNLLNLIVPDHNEKSRLNYLKIIGPGEMGFRGTTKAELGPSFQSLEEWTRAYCENPSEIKRFVLERTITNWDTSYLHGRLLSLLASTDFRGHFDITFPLTHSRVVIHSPDRYNRFFSDLTKVFTGTKKYEVVKAVWPYADVARGEQGRRCAVQEEDAWFESWKDAIKHAVVLRRSGWVTVEDRLAFLMEPKEMVVA